MNDPDFSKVSTDELRTTSLSRSPHRLSAIRELSQRAYRLRDQTPNRALSGDRSGAQASDTPAPRVHPNLVR